MTTPTRFAIYARYSSTEQDSNMSAEDQVAECRRHATQHDGVVVNEYVDRAKSGLVGDRAEYQKLLIDAGKKPRLFDVLLVWKFNRFDRAAMRSLANRALIRSFGIKVVSITEPIDPDDPTGEMMEMITAAIDQRFSKSLAQDVDRGMRHAVQRGYFVGGTPPFGYKVKPIKDRDGKIGRDGCVVVRKVLEPSPPEAKIVRDIFRIYIDTRRNWGFTRIAMHLNSLRIASPGQRLSESSNRRHGKGWDASSIKSILENEKYTGTMIYGKRPKYITQQGTRSQKRNEPSQVTRQLRTHPAIIQPATFKRVQEKLARRKKEYARGEYDKSGLYNSRYSLTGILKCGVCGSSYVISPRRHVFNSRANALKMEWRGPKEPRHLDDGRWEAYVVSYECAAAKKKGPEICKNRRQVPLVPLEAQLCKILKFEILNVERIKKVNAEVERLYKQLRASESQDKRELDSQRLKLEREIVRLTSHLARSSKDGVLRAIEEQLDKKQKLLEETQRSLDKSACHSLRLSQLRDLFNKRTVMAREIGNRRQFDDLRAFFREHIDVVRVFTDKIEVASRDSGPLELVIEEDDPDVQRIMARLWKRFQRHQPQIDEEKWRSRNAPSRSKKNSRQDIWCRRRESNPHDREVGGF